MLDNSDFKQKFISYFDEANLSKGRDPKLFKYAKESGGLAFYTRLKQQVKTVLVKDNFFFRFFFFGPEGIPETILPPCYQYKNHETLRQNMERMHVVNAEATAYLLSPKGKTITKASLSNIFEYVSPQEFEQVIENLKSSRIRPLRLVYWNLLQNQSYKIDSQKTTINEAQPNACFYFLNSQTITVKPKP